MLATLSSYEDLFGPYHPNTLRLLTEAGVACWRCRETEYARRLLERAVGDIGRHLSLEHEARVRALATLRHLLVEQCDYERAGVVQRELFDCQVARLGEGHPETIAARESLADLLLRSAGASSVKEC